MNYFKNTAHQLLDTLIRQAAVDGKDRNAELIIPYYELAHELGINDNYPMINLKIKIEAHFIDDGGLNDPEGKYSITSKICN